MSEGASVAQAASMEFFPMAAEGCLVLDVCHLVLVIVTLEVFITVLALHIWLISLTVPISLLKAI